MIFKMLCGADGIGHSLDYLNLKYFKPRRTLLQKYPTELALPWTPEPPGCLQWGQSGAESQPVQTPAARLGQHAWSDEPWRESEQWALFCGQDGNLSRDTSAGREVASPCTDVITACVWFTLHLLSASCFTFHSSWQSLNLSLWSSSMCLIPPLLSEWKQLQGYWCYGGKNVFISARTAGQTAAHSHSLCYAHLNSSRDTAYGG